MMPPFDFVCPTNKIAHFVEVSLYYFYLAQQVKYKKQIEKDEEIAEELQDRDQSYRRAEDQNT